MSDAIPAPDTRSTASSDEIRAEAGADVRAEAEADIGRALRNAMKLGGSLIATWGVALAVRILLPRELGPEGFGVYNFADAFSATCFIALTLGVDQYIHKEIPVRLSHASEFFAGFFLFRLAGAVLVAIAMWGIMVLGHRTPEVRAVVLFFAAMQVASLHSDSVASLLHAANRVDTLTIINILAKILWGGLLIGLAVGHASLWTLGAATFGVEALRSLTLSIVATPILKLRWVPNFRAAYTVAVASLPFFVNTIAHTAYSRVDATMLAFLSSDAEVGFYGAASNLGALTLVLTPLIGWVLMPLTARAAARSREELVALMQNSLQVILSLAIPIALGLGVSAVDLIHLAFGERFEASVGTLRILAPLFVVTYVAIVSSTCLIRLDRAWTVTLISLGGLAANPPLNLLLVPPAAKLFGPGGAGCGAAVALLLTEVGVTTAMLSQLRGELFTRTNVRSIVAGLLSAVAVLAADRFLQGPLGPWRYLPEALLYLVLATATGALKPQDIWRVVAQGIARRRSGA